MKSLDDEHLMELVKKGDEDAFARLFNRYHRLVLSIALRLLGNFEEAEDLMQEVFFEIYRKAENFKAEKGTVKTWILQYAYHRSFNRREFLNVRRFYDRCDMTELEVSPVAQTDSNWNGLSFHEWARIIEQGLAMLTERQRETVKRACYEGQSLREIADLLDESLGNVRNHYYRGLRRLRQYLDLRGQQSGPR